MTGEQVCFWERSERVTECYVKSRTRFRDMTAMVFTPGVQSHVMRVYTGG